MKILVIQQKTIGDVLTSTILFEALRKKFPKAELHYAVNAYTLPVLENNPFIDEMQVITRKMEKNKWAFYTFLKKIQNENYTIAIDVHGKISSGFIAYFSKAETRLAYHKNHNSFVYSKTIKRLENARHQCSLAIENRLRLLEPLDISFNKIRPKIYMKSEEVDSAKTTLLNTPIKVTKPLVMVSVLGSSPKKSYPKPYMAKLLDFCVAANPEIQFLFNYRPNQEQDAKSIYHQASAKTQEHIFLNPLGKSLREYLALVVNCNAVIGNEGGAITMAKALEIPTFSIFSPHLNKKEWFGQNEKPLHDAVHLSDFENFSTDDKVKAKKHPKPYYLKLKPELIQSQLNDFLNNLNL